MTWANFGGDGGELITAAVTLGVPHPPGYPTYVLIGKLFSLLPVGTVAYRFNLLSGVSTAVAAGFVTAIVYQITNHPLPATKNFIPAIATGLTFAFTSLVWSQAIIAEVYALNLAFVAAFLYFLLTSTVGAGLKPASNEPAVRSTVLIGLLLGLSLTTHLTSIIFLPLALFLIPWRRWGWFIGGFLVGLLPFLALPFLAQSDSPVIWGQPDTLSGWWWLVSARLYRPNLFRLPVSDWIGRFKQWSQLLLLPFVIIVLPLLGLGVFSNLKARFRLIAGLAATVLMYAAYAFTYNTFDAAVLILPALLLLSVLLGFGLQHLGKSAIILPIVLLWLNLVQPEHGYYVNQPTPIRPVAEELLDDTPSEAILITSGDPTLTALWYFHHVEGKRPDILIIDGNLFQFRWYREKLGRDYPFLQHLAQDDLPGFIELNRQSQPVCETSLVPPGYLRC
ncbi:MAG: DUF2723 domain-containing protein [Candidatus Promineifilaceae bacterium]